MPPIRWKPGLAAGSIVEDAPPRDYTEQWYGGPVVCIGCSEENRRIILEAVNAQASREPGKAPAKGG